MHEYFELMPCSYNEFNEKTSLLEPELLKQYSIALNQYRLAVQKERQQRGEQLQIDTQ